MGKVFDETIGIRTELDEYPRCIFVNQGWINESGIEVEPAKQHVAFFFRAETETVRICHELSASLRRSKSLRQAYDVLRRSFSFVTR